MTLTVRPSEARGHANYGWLDTKHSFSFAHYYDTRHMGYRDLRVINDDVVAGGGGFDTHGHRDMEIVTYLVRGALAHKDTTGAAGILRRGDVQAMTAGTGIRHSEFNASATEDLRLLQIWIMPDREGLAPAYRQAHVSDAEKRNRLRLVVAPGGEGGALSIHQDVRAYAGLIDAGVTVEQALRSGRGAWLQLVDGDVTVNGRALKSGDGAAIEETDRLAITAATPAEILLFDLA